MNISNLIKNKNLFYKINFLIFFTLIYSCKQKTEVINIGYIGPLTTKATNLGIVSSNTIKLAIAQYNKTRKSYEPIINFFIENDFWEKEKAISAYNKLKKEHQIKVLFISNTDGTIAVSNKAKKDKVIVVNPYTNDCSLDTLNNNIFRIAKSTEQIHSIIANRIMNTNSENVLIMHYPNKFMKIGSKTCQEILLKNNIKCKVVSYKKAKTDFTKDLKKHQKENYDAYVFFGYKESGYAMKQARDLGINSSFYGSNYLLNQELPKNHIEAIIGTEFIFFTPEDGNFLLANEFLRTYKLKYTKKPVYAWQAMQVYDATNIILSKLKYYTKKISSNQNFDDWLRNELLKIKFYEGVSGNISINTNGASVGIYFTLYEYTEKGKYIRIKY